MIKYICDMCGGEADKQEYIVPVNGREKTVAYKCEVPIMSFDKNVIVLSTIHLCDKCKKDIACIMNTILKGGK